MPMAVKLSFKNVLSSFHMHTTPVVVCELDAQRPGYISKRNIVMHSLVYALS
jgi:hypothetical protein